MNELMLSQSEKKQKNHSPFEELKAKIEAILFTAEAPLEVAEIRATLVDVSLSDVRLAIRDLAKDYEKRSFELVETVGKYQLRTKDDYIGVVKKQYAGKPRNLSKLALETLAIIAYRQPITRAQINSIRQVDSSSLVQALKEKELIYVSGTRKEVGNPLEFRTTNKFLEVFGLKSLADLPSLRSLQMSVEDQKQVVNAFKTLEEGNIAVAADEIGFMESEANG
ncbi:MAG: SMC-Scp complex subunit ScpB [Silvanigrellaceae bacterium]|nr:SMC-Scp complex subunit ScpB [Silvanigrellaceae bacterium]